MTNQMQALKTTATLLTLHTCRQVDWVESSWSHTPKYIASLRYSCLCMQHGAATVLVLQWFSKLEWTYICHVLATSKSCMC